MIDAQYVLHLETKIKHLEAKILDFYQYMDNDRDIYFDCRDVIEAYREKFNIKDGPTSNI